MKFYHVSPRRLTIGTVLNGQREVYYKPHTGLSLFMWNKPRPHPTMEGEIARSNHTWYLYRVVPNVKVTYCRMEDEYVCASATIVQVVKSISPFQMNQIIIKRKESKVVKNYNFRGQLVFTYKLDI